MSRLILMRAEPMPSKRASGGSHGVFRLGKFVLHVGAWLFLLALLAAGWELGGLPTVGLVLIAWLLPQIFVVALPDSASGRLAPGMATALIGSLAVVAAVVGLATTSVALPMDQILIGGAAVAGLLVAVIAESISRVLATTSTRGRLGGRALDDAGIARAGMFVGSLVAAVVLNWVDVAVTMLGSAGLFAVAASLVSSHLHRTARVQVLTGPHIRNAGAISRPIAMYLLAAVASGVLGGSLLVLSVSLAAVEPGWSATQAPFLVAAIAAGLVLGPLPVPRLLLRIPASLLLLATSLTCVAATIAIAVSASGLVAIFVLPAFGFAAVTQDALRAVAIRRLVPRSSYARWARATLLSLRTGQLVGAASVLIIGATADLLVVLLVVATLYVSLVGVGILLGGRRSMVIGGLSSLPIKSVVHKLSWDTRPPAVAADFTARGPRARRLAKWITRQAEVERLTVTLPVSKREYEIYRPNERSRERLFELGHADPDKQMPYWAKVWPSGVALADVVFERKMEVSDKHVLELGAGLGVTACAVLEFGGHLVTADYSALPLAHCRLNTVVNTDRSPRATCFNWRHDAEVEAVTAQAEFANGFPLIIAGDVLYEGRDAEPLLNVVDRLLVDDGSLWLAEPVRRTAQRFLDSAAGLGWEIDSRQVRAEWPDATDGPVNLHFLTRSPDPDRIVADLGGWRI